MPDNSGAVAQPAAPPTRSISTAGVAHVTHNSFEIVAWTTVLGDIFKHHPDARLRARAAAQQVDNPADGHGYQAHDHPAHLGQVPQLAFIGSDDVGDAVHLEADYDDNRDGDDSGDDGVLEMG